jgi:uncharacterized delta-60 repeat protein
VFGVALNSADGSVVAIGSFTSYHGVTLPGIVRLTGVGAVDPGFNVGTGPQPVTLLPGVTSPPQLQAVAVDGKGRIIVGGAFGGWETTTRSNFIRLTAAGAIDTSFNPSGMLGGVAQILPTPDGKLLVVGATAGGVFKTKRNSGFGRVNEDGSVDAGFPDNPLGDLLGMTLSGVPARRIARQADGKLLVIINGLKNGIAAQGIVRLNEDGTVDSGFHASATTPGSGAGLVWITVQPDGRILAGGDTINCDGHPVNQLFRLNADGTFDATFANQVPVFKTDWALPLPDGRLVASGTGWNAGANGFFAQAIVRLNADGTFDPTFIMPGNSDGGVTTLWYSVLAPAVQADGRLVLAGTIATPTPSYRIYQSVYRIDAGGHPEAPFILSAAVAQTNSAGSSAVFSVQAGGTPPLRYRWSFKGTQIAGATDARLVLPNVTTNSTGDYTCEVINDVSSVTSTAHLTVLPAIHGHMSRSTAYPEGVEPLFGGQGQRNVPLDRRQHPCLRPVHPVSRAARHEYRTPAAGRTD